MIRLTPKYFKTFFSSICNNPEISSLSEYIFITGTVWGKNPPSDRVRLWFMGWEDLLEKWKTTHSSILVWKIPWTTGLQRVRHTERLSLSVTGKARHGSHKYYQCRLISSISVVFFSGLLEGFTNSIHFFLVNCLHLIYGTLNLSVFLLL